MTAPEEAVDEPDSILGAANLVPAALVGLALAAQLVAAEVVIDIRGDTARVAAQYEFEQPVGSLRLSLMRLGGQEPHDVTAADAHRLTLEKLPGLWWLDVTAPSAQRAAPDSRRSAYSAQRTFYINYVVVGDLSRIPIAVPLVPAVPGAAEVVLRLSGIAAGSRLAEGFPRLINESDGWAVARLENLPSFVRLPPGPGEWSVSRGAQVFVVLLVICSGGIWIARGRWRRRLGAQRTALSAQHSRARIGR